MTGAGSLKAANYLYSVAPKDGSVIGTFSRSQGIAPLLDKAEFDSTKFTWLGSVTDEVSLCVTRHDAPVKTFSELLVTPCDLRRRGRGLRPQYLCAALPQRVRRQDQDRDRLSRHQRDPARDGARRGRRALRPVLEHAQGPLSALAQGQEGQHPVQAGIKKQPELADVPSATELATGAGSGPDPQIDPDRTGHGAAVRGPARHSRRSQGGADRGVRAHQRGIRIFSPRRNGSTSRSIR